MKLTIIFIMILMIANLAEARTFKAVVRTENNHAKEDFVELDDLISENSFDGKYFKIVAGKSDEAITFEADEELVFRAATAYHHLTIARNYFINTLKSEHVAILGKMLIRIEHKNQFSELAHFAHDDMEPQFNNALTIPAGMGLASKGVKPWGNEIWFRPKKKINLSDLSSSESITQSFKGLMSSYRNQTHMSSLQSFLMSLTNPNFFSLDSIMRTAGTSIIMEAAYQLGGPIANITARRWYWLDTALVPEIIYHEFSHAALSDHLVLSHSTPIIEGMADFFAGQISGSPKLAMHIKKYNTFNGKNAAKKQDYAIEFETNSYANSDFVFGLLWETKNILGEEKGENFIFDLRKQLDTNSTIRGQLIEGILKTCNSLCDQPFVDKIRILKALNLRAI